MIVFLLETPFRRVFRCPRRDRQSRHERGPRGTLFQIGGFVHYLRHAGVVPGHVAHSAGKAYQYTEHVVADTDVCERARDE